MERGGSHVVILSSLLMPDLETVKTATETRVGSIDRSIAIMMNTHLNNLMISTNVLCIYSHYLGK